MAEHWDDGLAEYLPSPCRERLVRSASDVERPLYGFHRHRDRQCQRIAGATECLNLLFDQPLRIEDLASEVSLSTSAMKARHSTAVNTAACLARHRYATWLTCAARHSTPKKSTSYSSQEDKRPDASARAPGRFTWDKLSFQQAKLTITRYRQQHLADVEQPCSPVK
jgi:hypothetical protein